VICNENVANQDWSRKTPTSLRMYMRLGIVLMEDFQVWRKRHSDANRNRQAGAISRIACSKSNVKSKLPEQLSGPKLVAEQAHVLRSMMVLGAMECLYVRKGVTIGTNYLRSRVAVLCLFDLIYSCIAPSTGVSGKIHDRWNSRDLAIRTMIRAVTPEYQKAWGFGTSGTH
jgi:hypothetical protein